MKRCAAVFSLGILLSLAPAPAAEGAWLDCTLRYRLEGWSFFYKTARGSGRVTCTNGQSADVRITSHGGGLSFGAGGTLEGGGTVSRLERIDEVFGFYAEAVAHAGAGGAVDARVATKGDVSLALTGAGRGLDLGFALGSFRIERR